MTTVNPLRKPVLERTTPHRHMVAAYRRADVPSRKRARPGGPLNSPEEVVVQAVKLGYKIADEQILKGQEIARRLRGASVRSGSGDVGDLLEQGMRLARQVAILMVELTETTTQAPTLLRAVFDAACGEKPRAKSGSKKSESEAAAPDASSASPAPATVLPAVPIEVTSKRPTRASLVLSKVLPADAVAYPLVLTDGDRKTPQYITGVRFVTAGKGAPFLEVIVEDTQAPGQYCGYAVDNAGQPVGTITVSVK